MSELPALPPRLESSIRGATPEKTLRRVFLTLFLRGRSSRGLQKDTAPKSVGSKLALILCIYTVVGAMMTLMFLHQKVFALSIYTHSMTLMFLGMFVAASAGEVLFNKEEADILLHRPITPRALLWAKIGMLVQVSLWLAGALNLASLFVGLAASDGNLLFPLVHAFSVTLEALFCTGSVVLVYQLCLGWFGRERLEGLMTTAQVIVSIGAVMGSQIMPQMMRVVNGKISFGADKWWMGLLPPAWFAGLDDAVAGSSAGASWLLAGIGVAATAVVLWLAFGKLAQDYATGLQTLGETISRPRKKARRRWLERLVNAPPLSWWLRNSVSRASFLLVAAYLVRDRDVKMRVYPGIAPMLIFPFMMLIQQRQSGGEFMVALIGSFLGMIPLLGVSLLQYSQQWQAADLFRLVPMSGPASLCHGARRAVLCFMALPMLGVFGLLVWFAGKAASDLLLLLPGIIALPVYALVPNVGGPAVPLSLPVEEAKSAQRSLVMTLVMFVSMALSGLAMLAWNYGWFQWFLLVEVLAAIAIYAKLRASLEQARWSPIE